jgi:Site-specific DNA methylase
LSGNGYKITAHKYRAEDYGVPQTRHRVILVGVDKTLNKRFRVPAPTHLGDSVSCRQAIEFPPIATDAPNNRNKKKQSKSSKGWLS